MNLPRDGREYVSWPIAGQPDDATFEITFDHGETWLPMETTETGARILVAGPDADAGSATVLPAGRNRPEIRLTDNPEIIVRSGGVIVVKGPESHLPTQLTPTEGQELAAGLSTLRDDLTEEAEARATADAAKLDRPPTYTLAARPAATGSGAIVFVSDANGGQLQQDTAADTWTPLAPGASQASLGLITSASRTSNVTGIGTTITDVTGLSVTWTAVAGATYWVFAKFFVGNVTTATTTTGYLTDSANTVVDTGAYVTRSANDSQIMVYQTFITPSAGTQTYKARLKSSAGSTAFVLGDPTYPARINVLRVA